MTRKIAVALPVRQAEATIEATLASLLPQCQSLNAELIVAVSETDPTAALLRSINTRGARVLYKPGLTSIPQLRRAAVLATEADFIVIVEDHVTVPDGWLRGLVDAIDQHNVDVSGGGVNQGLTHYAGWAQYFTRYSNFMAPLNEGPTKMLPGNNACYRRKVFDDNRNLLKEGFWEAEFNHEISAEKAFWMCSNLSVTQHQHRGLLAYIPLRYRHGRCYGARRYQTTAPADRRKLVVQSPLIPLVLFVRAARAVFNKSHHQARFLSCCPLLAIYFLAWGVGEMIGYLRGAGGSCAQTD